MHEFSPLYVPLMLVLVTLADPLAVTLQSGNPEIPPRGTTKVKPKVVPDRVPEIVPLKAIPIGVPVAVIVPLTAEPFCDKRHVIRPPPLESVASPDQAPVRFSVGVDGEFGL